MYIESKKFHCSLPYPRPNNLDSMQHVFREHFVKETQDQMIFQLRSIKGEVFTNTNISLSNETSLDADTDYYYDLHIMSTEHKILHFDIY